ncbi:hypothetical protein ACG5V6_27630, partial [Streptomyces chitinivorans]
MSAETGAERTGRAGRTREAGGSAGAGRRPSRRFPLITRDTARPEGGGRAAPRGLRSARYDVLGGAPRPGKAGVLRETAAVRGAARWARWRGGARTRSGPRGRRR